MPFWRPRLRLSHLKLGPLPAQRSCTVEIASTLESKGCYGMGRRWAISRRETCAGAWALSNVVRSSEPQPLRSFAKSLLNWIKGSDATLLLRWVHRLLTELIVLDERPAFCTNAPNAGCAGKSLGAGRISPLRGSSKGLACST